MSARHTIIFGSVAALSTAALIMAPVVPAMASDVADASALGVSAALDLSSLPVVTGEGAEQTVVANGLAPTAPLVDLSLLNTLSGDPVTNLPTIQLLGLKAVIGSDRLLHLTSPALGITATTPLDSRIVALNPALASVLGVQLKTGTDGSISGTTAQGTIVLFPGTPSTSPTTAPTASPTVSPSTAPTQQPNPSVSIGVTLFPTSPVSTTPSTVPTTVPMPPAPTTTPTTPPVVPIPNPSTPANPTTPGPAPLTGGTMRIAGEDRYSTAVAAASNSHDNPEYVVLASGENGHLVDALAASPLAAALNAPIVTVPQNSMPSATWAYLNELPNLRGIVVIGAQASISDGVANLVGQLASNGVLRIGGTDRYETSALIAKKFSSASHVYVASGSDGHLVDAVAVAGIAAHLGSPILLAPNEGGTPSSVRTQIARLNPSKIDALGGPNAVSEQVQSELGATRIAGGNRYETAVMSARAANLPTAGDRVVLASGLETNLVDALVTSSFKSTTVLTAPGATTLITREYLGEVNPA